MLRERRAVRAVVEPDRKLQPFGQHIAHRLIGQRNDVARLEHNAVFIIDKRRKRRADAANIRARQSMLLHQLLRLTRQNVQQLIRFQLFIRQSVDHIQRMHFGIKQTDLAVGTANVDADCVFAHCASSKSKNIFNSNYT